MFTDAHNLVIEYLTTTGILGSGALFCGSPSFNGSRPPGRSALVLVAMELAEPLNAAVLPVALAALGAAGPLPVTDGGRAARRRLNETVPSPFHDRSRALSR